MRWLPVVATTLTLVLPAHAGGPAGHGGPMAVPMGAFPAPAPGGGAGAGRPFAGSRLTPSQLAHWAHAHMHAGLSGAHTGGGSEVALRERQLAEQARQLIRLHQAELGRLTGLVHKLAAAGDTGLRSALADADAHVRFAAAWVVGDRGAPLHRELIRLLTDHDGYVRQAARRGLVLLARKEVGPGDQASAHDFGPTPQSGRKAHAKAARRWEAWWSEREQAASAAPAETR